MPAGLVEYFMSPFSPVSPHDFFTGKGYRIFLRLFRAYQQPLNVFLVQIIKVGMMQGVLDGDAILRIVSQK